MGVCERGVHERPRGAETSPKTKTTEIMARLYKTMLANTCRRLRSRIVRAMEAGVIFWGKAGCRYTKEHVCKISSQYIHFHRSYDSFCNVRTFVLIYRTHPVFEEKLYLKTFDISIKGTNPLLKKSLNIPEIYEKIFGRFH